MKRRTKRDISIFLGVVIMIPAVWLMNSELGRSSNREDYEKLLIELQAAELAKDGSEAKLLLKWEHMRKTKGSLRKGGKYSEEVLARDGDYINLIGFMVPQEQFRDVNEFLLLPIPLECYFCSMPPARDVMLIQMKEGTTTNIAVEPVILNGLFKVNQGPDQKFYYQMDDVELGGLDGGELTKKRLKLEHMIGGAEHPKDDDSLLAPSKSRRVSGTDATD